MPSDSRTQNTWLWLLCKKALRFSQNKPAVHSIHTHFCGEHLVRRPGSNGRTQTLAVPLIPFFSLSLLPHLSAATPLPLTSRQRQVLELLCQGLTNKEIAAQLRRSEHTVRSHVQAILTILQVSCRTEAADAARRLGLVL